MATKNRQLNVRVTSTTDRWLERVAGGKDKKAEYVRRLIEADMRRKQEEIELAMFNAAAADLTDEDRKERDDLLAAFSNQDAEG